MRVEYINPFVDSAIEILKQTVSKDIVRQELALKSSITPVLGCALIVGLAGQVKGRVLIDMRPETGLNIASVMNNEKLTEYDDLATSTLTELANMIVGKAVTKLHDLGFQFDLTPPAMMLGENLRISDKQLESIIVPLELPQGLVEINVALKEEKY